MNRSGNILMPVLILGGIVAFPLAIVLLRHQTLLSANAIVAKKGYVEDVRQYFTKTFSCSDPGVVLSCYNGISPEYSIGVARYRFECDSTPTKNSVKVWLKPKLAMTELINLFPTNTFTCPPSMN